MARASSGSAILARTGWASRSASSPSTSPPAASRRIACYLSSSTWARITTRSCPTTSTLACASGGWRGRSTLRCWTSSWRLSSIGGRRWSCSLRTLRRARRCPSSPSTATPTASSTTTSRAPAASRSPASSPRRARPGHVSRTSASCAPARGPPGWASAFRSSTAWWRRASLATRPCLGSSSAPHRAPSVHPTARTVTQTTCAG
mmetsp:Transcript_57178/g.150174  ORF Transcript_57178/g.150174 Transcript_57178/m.150174 type:complete len:204 (-) Transcript_57178:899-1510(-)